MVIVEMLIRLMNPRKRRVLALAEMNMEQEKFLLFKKEFLRGYGNSELVRDMERELAKSGKERSGAASAERNGQEYTCRKGGAEMSERIHTDRDSIQASSGGLYPPTKLPCLNPSCLSSSMR